MKRSTRRERLLEDLFDRIAEFLHHVIGWLPLAGSAFVTVILHLAWSKWLDGIDDPTVRMWRWGFILAEAGAIATMVIPSLIEAGSNLLELAIVKTRRASALARGADPAQLELKPGKERDR